MSYNWQEFSTFSPSFEIPNAKAGTYEIEVIAINGLGERSNASRIKQIVAPQENIPPDPTGVTITAVDEFVALVAWNDSGNAYVNIGGKTLIYHQATTTGASWDYSTQIVEPVSGAQNSTLVPLLEGTYLVKFSTSQNVRSLQPGQASIRAPEPNPLLLVTSIEADNTGFIGNGKEIYYDAIKDGLVLAVGHKFDDFAPDSDFDGISSIDLEGGVSEYGEYILSSIYDMGGVYDAVVVRRLQVEPYNVATYFDDNIVEIDTWGDFDSIDVTDANASVYVRTTDDDPTVVSLDSFPGPIDAWTDFDYGFTDWDEWRPCTNNLVTGRGFQFKSTITSFQANQNLVVKELGAKIKLRQRTERSISAITSGTSAYQVTFGNAFYQTPTVSITSLQMAAGDYYTIASLNSTGFQVSFFDSAGNPVSRLFTYMAVGYGRRR
jgi:hypothetical protein